jgi:CubicO group peptidase (beta-lactamase class C family)
MASEEVRKLLAALVEEGGETGLQVAAYLDGRLVIDTWAGLSDPESTTPVDGDTLFTAFSISKGITATCIHILADRGLVQYDAPVARYWPEFAAHGKATITLRHVLTHQAGIPHDPPDFDLSMAVDWEAVCRAVADLEPRWEPGTKTGYHPLTYGWVLGEVVRRVDGRSISVFLQDEVCRPLGISGMFFGVPPGSEHRIATLINAESHPQMDLSLTPSISDVAGSFNRRDVRRAVIPGAGAITNARSLARMYAVLAAGGDLNGVRLLSPERIRIATTAQPENAESAEIRWWTAHGLGYTLGGGPGPRADQPQAFGYEGIGTIGFADPGRKFAFAFLKNLLDLSEDEMNTATLVARAVEEVLGIA